MTDPFDQLSPYTPEEEPTAELADHLAKRIAAIEARNDRAERGRWHLAQLNLGLFVAPLDSPEMAPFAEALDRINAIAEATPGFVWRLVDDDGGSSSNVEVPEADDPLMAANLSVWTDVKPLYDFMYRSDHRSYLRRRHEWFESVPEVMTVGWWLPAGDIPTLAEAVRRLEHLRAHGPSDEGFPLSRNIPPPPTSLPSTAISPLTAQPATPEATVPGALSNAVIPYLTVGDGRAALAFYAEVFGAETQGEVFEMDDGRLGHAEFVIDGQVFYLADEFPEMNLRTPGHVGSNSVSMVIRVDDCDAVYDHALLAGATGERPPANQHGFRSGWFVDPWGHRWSPTGPETAGL